MPFPYVYYSRKNLNATEVQFFNESRAEATNKERDTNMPKAYQLDKDFHVKKIKVIVPVKTVSSTTAKDSAIDDNYVIPLQEAILEFQIGDGPIWYFPVCEALAGPPINVALAYTLATAADGSYGVLNVNGGQGLDVDFTIPANTDIKVYIKTTSTPSINPVTIELIGEHP